MENRPKMSREERAKQFMPFAALKGYTEALRQKETILVPRMELTEEYREQLDRILRTIQKQDIVTATYFHQNKYVKKTGIVSRIDIDARILQIVNTRISFDDLYEVIPEGSHFSGL